MSAEAYVLAVDDAGRATHWNRALVDLLGAAPARVEDVVLDGDRRRLARALAVARERTATLRARAGEAVVRWTLTALEGSGGVLLRGQRDGDLAEAEEDALAAMGQLTRAMAHEVKNPLNAALLQNELLERGLRSEARPDGEALAERAALVGAQVRRVSRLLDDFLALARPDRLDVAPVDAGALVEEVVRLHAEAARERGATVSATVMGELSVDGDAARLRVALVQLVANAIDAVGEGGAVDVRAEGVDAEVWIRVDDDGPGLPAPAPVLMRPFVSTKDAGTGLGLPLAARIVRAHGGALDLTERPEGGSSAKLILPARVAP